MGGIPLGFPHSGGFNKSPDHELSHITNFDAAELSLLTNFLTIERSFMATVESLDFNSRPTPSTLSPVPSITTTATSDGGIASAGNKFTESLKSNDSVEFTSTIENQPQTIDIVTFKTPPQSSQESHV